MDREGGVVPAAVLHVQDQGQVEDRRLQCCVFFIRAQQAQYIFSRRQFTGRLMDV